MTKRDYERMVAIIAATWQASGKEHCVHNTLTDLAKCFAAFAAKDNPAFSKQRFLLAVERVMV